MKFLTRSQKYGIGLFVCALLLVFFLYNLSKGQDGERCLVGDVNGNGIVDNDDIVYMLDYIYSGGPYPVVCSSPQAFFFDLFRLGQCYKDTTRGLYWFTLTSRSSIETMLFQENIWTDSLYPKQARNCTWFSNIHEGVIFVRFQENQIREKYRWYFTQVTSDMER